MVSKLLADGRDTHALPHGRFLALCSTELDVRWCSSASYSLFPEEPGGRRPPSRRIFSVRPDQNGRYALPDVPAGDYLITAVADIEPGDWFNPDVLAHLAPTAAPVSIRRGDALEIDLETR